MHDPPTLVVTGANGFIGSGLTRHFHGRGWRVTALVHHVPARNWPGIEYFPYELDLPPPEAPFVAADALVHCAYLDPSRHPGAAEINLAGFRRLLELCRTHGARMVLLSSFSAREGAESEYARIKLSQEALCDPSIDLVLRAALVIGRGGLAGRMLEAVHTRRVLPVPGAGRPVQIIALADLCRIVEVGLERKLSGIFRVAHPGTYTMKSLLAALAGTGGHRALLLPVPVTPLVWLARLVEATGLKFPVTSSNLLGLKTARAFDTRADLAAFGLEVGDLEEAVKALASSDVRTP